MSNTNVYVHPDIHDASTQVNSAQNPRHSSIVSTDQSITNINLHKMVRIPHEGYFQLLLCVGLLGSN